MKAALLTEYNDSRLSPLEIVEVDDPKPEGPFDVIIKVEGAGVCRTDLHIMAGYLRAQSDPDRTLLPYIPGHENAGMVVDVGSAVTTIAVGDPVVCHPIMSCGLCMSCRRGEDVFCTRSGFPGLNRHGGFAEYLRTNERAVLRVPDGLDLVKAAPLSDAGLTAYRAVQAVGPMLRPGKTCVVLGVGGLGRLAIQLVRALYPVPVIAIDKAEQARAAAAVCGATHIFDVTDRTVTDVHDATRGGAAAVLDFVGEKGAENLAWRLLAPGGAHQVVGYGGVVKIPTGILVGGEYRLAGTQVGTFVELAELLEVCQAGLIDVPVQRFALADVNAAIEALAAGTVDGRAVLQP